MWSDERSSACGTTLQVERPGLHGVQVVPGLLGEVQGGPGLAAGYHVPADVQLKEVYKYV